MALGFAWILASTYLGGKISTSETTLLAFEMSKGFLFVIVAGALNYFLLIRHGERVLASETDSLKELEKSRAYLRNILDSLPVQTAVIDAEGRVQMLNRSWSQAHPSAPCTFDDVPRDGAEVFPPEVRAPLAEILSGREERFAVEVRQPGDASGEDRRYLVQGSVLSAGQNGAVLNCVEVTERERLRNQFDELARLESLGKIAGTVAHEFNNVLMGIVPFTEILERTYSGDDQASSAIRHIQESVNRGRRISNEVLRFAHPEKPEPVNCSISEFMNDVERVCLPLLRADQRLEVIKPATDHQLLVDCNQMHQVFVNLVINSTHALSDDGTIAIRADYTDHSESPGPGVDESGDGIVHFRVIDQGSGIPSELLDRIFEPMFTTRNSGTGLGLATARRIVTANGGSIFAESEPGSGTTMHLFLPYYSESGLTRVS